jgi:hypothetical protein
MRRRHLLVVLLVVLFLFAWAMPALAPRTAAQGGGYDLTWSTIDGGGATFSTSGSYTLGGTAGQPDAGSTRGGNYTLVGGFWSGVSPSSAPGQYRIHLPLVMRG